MSPTTARSIDVPLPVSVDPDRWRPTRMGLVNVWQYTDEVLEFERGRMVLFGPNGSGKTMALELLLPHLLDARGQPGRLSTSGADRGGLWERVTGYDAGEPRTGYLWVELVRGDGASFTIGVRLRAKPSGGGDKHWFSTTQRIGIDLELLDGNRVPLSVEALGAALGAQGKVWGRDTDGYRQAVRTTLFPGWSDDRLEALVRTLLVVRKQNVSDGLSTKRLSELLSESLPPLDDQEIDRVADGFADLDRRRDHIDRLAADVAVTKRLRGANRSYARAITARVVADVVGATTAFDNVARKARTLSEQLDAGEELKRELDERVESLESESTRLHAQLDGLRSSEAYKHGAELDNLQRQADQARRIAEGAEETAAIGERDSKARQDRAAAARERHARAVVQCQRAREEMHARAESLGAPLAQDASDGRIVPLMRAWADGRRRAIREVRAELHAHELAVQRRQLAGEDQQGCESNLGAAEERLRAAVTASAAARSRWDEVVTAWRSSADELSPLLPALDDPSLAAAAVAQAKSDARDPLLARRSDTRGRWREVETVHHELREELSQWRAGRDPEPEAPAGRRDRSGIAGAPLWRLVQFREPVPKEVRDGLEAALVDSRLLDAWVTPDGGVTLDDDESELFAMAGGIRSRTGDERTLRDVIEPDPETEAVDREVLVGLLATITVVSRNAEELPAPASGIVIGEDGSWRTARLAGRAAVGEARYVGATSRASFRKSKIAALEQEVAEQERALAILNAEIKHLEARLGRCDDEAAKFPATTEIEEAERAVAAHEARVESSAEALRRANERLRSANELVKRHQAALAKIAMAHALPTEPDRLDDVDDRVAQIDQHVSTFERRLHAQQLAAEAAERDEEAALSAQSHARTLRETARERRRELEKAVNLHATVEQAVGADYHDVLEQVRHVTGRQAEIGAEQKQTNNDRVELGEQIGEIRASLDTAEQQRNEADERRTRANESFTVLCREGMVQDADVGVSARVESLTSGTAILEVARQLRAQPQLSTPADDARVIKLTGDAMARVGDASRQLSGRADLTFEPMQHDWAVLRAHRDGIVTSIAALLSTLEDELETARTELTRKQQELFEKILSGSVREHLKERLWAAQDLVDRINDLLGNVQTASAGVKIQLKWEIDPNLADAAELREAKRLLLRDSPVAEGRAELDAFLRERIELVRADDADTGEWKDRLGRMLDYRSWHRFQVLVHHTRFGDKPRSLDSRKVSLSAGEKTIVMVLPLLVAVTAHYEPPPGEAPCGSPRLLLMDELFPKLDTPNKRQLLGLLPTLDLDAVFTSDKDRCEYDTLDGIAIQLFQKLDDDKTTTTRLVWNGSDVVVSPPHIGGNPLEARQRKRTLLPVEE